LQAIQAIDQSLRISPRDYVNLSTLWAHRARACLQQGQWELGVNYFSVSSSYATVVGSPTHYRHRAILFNLGDYHPAAHCSFMALDPETQHRVLADPTLFWGSLRNIAAHAEVYRALGVSRELWTAPIGAMFKVMPLTSPTPAPTTSLDSAVTGPDMATRTASRTQPWGGMCSPIGQPFLQVSLRDPRLTTRAPVGLRTAAEQFYSKLNAPPLFIRGSSPFSGSPAHESFPMQATALIANKVMAPVDAPKTEEPLGRLLPPVPLCGQRLYYQFHLQPSCCQTYPAAIGTTQVVVR
jgi:hypothetical protein